MDRLTPVLALAAGATIFAGTVLLVETLLSLFVEFALILAVPIGIGTGMATMTVVYVGLADDPGSRHYQFALGLGAMGVTFLAVLGVALLTGTTWSTGLLAAGASGALALLGVVIGSTR